MARGRMISKSLSTSQKFASLGAVAGKLGEFCQALYPLLVAHSDDWGRQEGDIFTVKMRVHPASPRPQKEFEAALWHLHTVHLLTWYEYEGRKYIQINDFDRHQQGLHKRTPSRFPEVPADSGKFPEVPSQLNRTELNRTELNRSTDTTCLSPPRNGGSSSEAREREAIASPPPLVAVAAKDQAAPKGKVEAFAMLWNETTTAPLPRCRDVSASRRRKIATRLRERGMGEWLEVFRRIETSTFCRGQNDRGWKASFDWVIDNEDNATKVLEGKYDDRGSSVEPTPPCSRCGSLNGPCALHDQECVKRALQAAHGGAD